LVALISQTEGLSRLTLGEHRSGSDWFRPPQHSRAIHARDGQDPTSGRVVLSNRSSSRCLASFAGAVAATTVGLASVDEIIFAAWRSPPSRAATVTPVVMSVAGIAVRFMPPSRSWGMLTRSVAAHSRDRDRALHLRRGVGHNSVSPTAPPYVATRGASDYRRRRRGPKGRQERGRADRSIARSHQPG